LAGALAVIVAAPGATQVATPVASIVATAVFDDFQVRPSATESIRLVLSSNVPVALYATVACELLMAVAVAGLTAMLTTFG